MARVIKIDNSIKKRFQFKELKEKKKRSVIAYFLIVCEGGKTEPNYFKSFPKNNGSFVFETEFGGGGLNTVQVVEKAIELRDKSSLKFDRVWAVFDRDSFTANNFNNAIRKAKANNIRCAWSNQAFELWYLLHFHNRVTAMNRDDYKNAIENAINSLATTKEKFTYQKNAPNMYHILQEHGREDLALKWAAKLADQYSGENYSTYNPSTFVYKLVEELNGTSEILNNEIRVKYNSAE